MSDLTPPQAFRQVQRTSVIRGIWERLVAWFWQEVIGPPQHDDDVGF